MLDTIVYNKSVHFFVYLMISFSFFVGILLVVSQEAFDAFNNDLKKEYGLKHRLFPKIENAHYHFIDFIIVKFRLLAGLMISITAFLLLLLNKF